MNIKEEVKNTMDFLGMLGFLPDKTKKAIAEKWLNTIISKVYGEGKADGLQRAREIMGDYQLSDNTGEDIIW